jgi:protein-tyrosine phosphatase
MNKTAVLFVCMGNICRSPMAEAVFRDLAAKKGLSERFLIASAATGNWHLGQPPHAGTLNILAKNGIHMAGKRAQKLTRQDLETYDYILVMDEENVEDVQHHFGVSLPRLLDYAPAAAERDIPDPYYNGNFSEVFRLVSLGCQGLLESILRKEMGG